VFSHEGPNRNLWANGLLAGYLAFIAGYCNSGGYVLIGSFTSHVTGSVGRISNDVAIGEPGAAIFGVVMVLTFFAGAFAATLILETYGPRSIPRAYGTALLGQGIVLMFFIFIAGFSQSTHPRLLDAEASLLCFAMGMQNSLVTRLSGAVIRTTHLTGVMTDLAIEAARWYRWHRSKLPHLIGPRVPASRPVPTRSVLLTTIIVTFIGGAVLGAILTARISRWAMILPAAGVLAAAAVAFVQARFASTPFTFRPVSPSSPELPRVELPPEPGAPVEKDQLH
jgi:uncharacterized membrane protein YoaK (UPF0700 family)